MEKKIKEIKKLLDNCIATRDAREKENNSIEVMRMNGGFDGKKHFSHYKKIKKIIELNNKIITESSWEARGLRQAIEILEK